jgi:UDP-N-acetylmuramoyl-tripeptide--D-alanyl-D-alanine ligase
MQSGSDMGPGIPLSRVLTATGGSVVRTGTAAAFSQVVIDGRAGGAGALFFAIKGDRFDGADFAGQAVQSGATGVVVARGRAATLKDVGSATVIEVDDTVQALGRLGRAHRESLTSLRVVAITGSNGKTTTKEMVASILSAAAGPASVLKTEGNLNNHLGVPLTLLRLNPSHRYAVIEMGMSALGEIAYLSGLAQPDVAVVVSIAAVHLEHLGSLENIARAKGEIWSGLQAGGFAVYPVDEARLLPHVATVPTDRRFTFGPLASNPTVAYDEVRSDARGLVCRLHLRGLTSRSGVEARIGLVGAHNASNAAAAAAACRALDVGEGSILEGLSSVKPAKHRLQLVDVGDRTVLDDCYNASPLSMRAALDALVATTPAHRQRVAVLGDMLELGPESRALHEELGRYAADRVDLLIATGSEGRHLVEGARPKLGDRALHLDDVQAAAARAWSSTRAGDVILVKASRGMKLERVIDWMSTLAAEPR